MIETRVADHAILTADIHKIAPLGFAIAHNIARVTPEFFHSTFPEKWRIEYRKKNYAFFDPVLAWASTMAGCIRWSDLPPQHTLGRGWVMTRAADQGLRFGCVISCKSVQSHHWHMFTCSRSDVDFSANELNQLENIFNQLVDALDHSSQSLTNVERELMTQLANGNSVGRISDVTRVSVNTINKRIAALKQKLGAKNASNLIAIAYAKGLLGKG